MSGLMLLGVSSGGGALTDRFLNYYDDTASGPSGGVAYTFADVPIGTADATRVVVVSVFTGSFVHSGVNIAGGSATLAANTGFFSIYYRVVSSGTTATIEVLNTSGGSMSRCRIGVHICYPASSTPTGTGTDTATGTTSVIASNVTIASGGFLVWIGGYGSSATATFDVTWNGIDPVDLDVDGPANVLESTATISIGNIVCTETNSTYDLTLATTNATSGSKQIVAAAWGA